MSKEIFKSEPERIINYKDLTKEFKKIEPPLKNDCVIIYAVNLTNTEIHICDTIDYTKEVLSLEPGTTCMKDLGMRGTKAIDYYWEKGESFYIRWAIGKKPTKGDVRINMLFKKRADMKGCKLGDVQEVYGDNDFKIRKCQPIIINKKYGHWTVLEQISKLPAVYACQCKCGKILNKEAHLLRHYHPTACCLACSLKQLKYAKLNRKK